MSMKALRDIFGESLVDIGRTHPEVVVLDADLSSATRSKFFAAEFPDRFFNIGIAEANMVSIGAGLSNCEKTPFVCTFSFLFSLRALDQIRSQICYPNNNVKLMGTNAGLSGFGDGATHQCVLDLAIMRAMPEMTVVVPSDEVTVRKLVSLAADHVGPLFLRIPRVEAPTIHEADDELEIGKGVLLRKGSDITIAAIGLMVEKALKAAEALAKEGIDAEVIEFHTLKPFDAELLLQSIRKTGALVAAEEHSKYGGLYSEVCEISAAHYPVPAKSVAIEDRFGQTGQYDELLDEYGLTEEKIITRAKEVLEVK